MTGTALDPTAAFFGHLAADGPRPLLGRAGGTLLFDLAQDGGGAEHWHVTLADGAVKVSHRRDRADCNVRAARSLFDDLATGRANTMSAFLRGALVVEGDVGLLFRFQRLFPNRLAA